MVPLLAIRAGDELWSSVGPADPPNKHQGLPAQPAKSGRHQTKTLIIALFAR